ncbi:hypothetical protein Ccrd_014044, partial [Cynara cardunculus var. scolymus]
MPGITLVARETMNSVCNCSYSRGSGQMCRQEPHIQLSQEEQNAAEESLSVYCKPVELYNILQRRAINNPLFLQRCLRYKLQAKNKRSYASVDSRIQISVSISGAINDGMYAQNLFPLYVLLARPLSTTNMEMQHSAVYRFSQACRLTAFNGAETQSAAHAKFLLPEISKLSAEVKSGSLAMLLVSCGMALFATMFEGNCLLGKIPMDLLHLSWERSPNLSLGGRAEMMASVSMRYCDMKLSGLDEEKCISFRFQYNSEAVSILQQVPVMVSAEELGAKDISAYDLYSYSDIPDNSLPHIVRLRAGNVVFKYKYYNDMLQRSEVTEDFTCPFCLVRCASYTGLRFHLTSSHDLFRFQFWVGMPPKLNELKEKTDCLTSLCSTSIHVPEGAKCDTYSPNATSVSIATGVSFAEPESGQSVPGSNLAPPAMLQFAKTRKLSVERSDPRNRALLQKRQFFHSHRAQPMALEQVFAEQDSEDEVDDDVADLEDRRMLDDFVDVAKEEKHMMHLWNSFVRKQRCWKLLIVKLWNHGLVDSRTMNKCNQILDHIHPTTTTTTTRSQ